MNGIISFVLSAIQITMLDIVLSGDNVGVIALATRNLNPKLAKKASIIGVAGAISLRILFASIVTVIMTVSWLPIRLAGGLLLLKITWSLVKNGCDEEEEGTGVKSSQSFWKAVFSIIVADVSMSLDNILAIGGAADGHVGLIIFGLALNIPVIFFGSRLAASLMRKYRIVIYIGAAILIHTALAMIMEDSLVSPYVNHILAQIVPWTIAAATLAYGYFMMKKPDITA